MLAERIKLNAEAVEENLGKSAVFNYIIEYRNICFDAVINSHKEEDKQDKISEVGRSLENMEESKNLSSLPPGVEVEDTPPMSPAYMERGRTDSEQPIYCTKGVRRGTRTKQTARKAVGGKGLKRKRKASTSQFCKYSFISYFM